MHARMNVVTAKSSINAFDALLSLLLLLLLLLIAAELYDTTVLRGLLLSSGQALISGACASSVCIHCVGINSVSIELNPAVVTSKNNLRNDHSNTGLAKATRCDATTHCWCIRH
jgi:hypothetical protein